MNRKPSSVFTPPLGQWSTSLINATEACPATEQVTLRSNVHLCCVSVAICVCVPRLEFPWQPTVDWQDRHSVRHIKNKQRQGDTNTLQIHTADTHCLGQQGGLASSAVLVRGSEQQQRVAPSAAPSVHRAVLHARAGEGVHTR